MKSIILIASPFVLLYVAWIIYLAVMALSRAKKEGTLTKWTYGLGLILLWGGLTLDCILNATLLSIIFMEPPKEWTMTARLKRHALHGDKPWCMKVVAWFRQFVDPFDPKGRHL